MRSAHSEDYLAELYESNLRTLYWGIEYLKYAEENDIRLDMSNVVVDRQDEYHVYGHTVHGEVIRNWSRRIKDEPIDLEWVKTFWFLQAPHDMFALMDLHIGSENARYIQKIFEDDWINGVYYVVAACDDIREHADAIAKLIINDLSALANERNIAIRKMIHPLSANQLFKMVFRDDQFEKRYFREIAGRLIDGTDISEILNDPKYAKEDLSKLKSIAIQVIEEHLDKIDGSDKINNWIMGQVMKALKGRGDPSVIRAILPELIIIAKAK